MTPDRRQPSEPSMPASLPALRVDDRFVDRLANAIADRIAGRLPSQRSDDDGYLTPAAAARYLGVTRKRIHDLASSRRLIPDGHDGRTPLYRRQTLDTYVRESPDP
jgi:hypothetical protein